MAGKDLTLAELRKFDGSGDGGLIYVAINGKIFDVTEKGKQFYGPGRWMRWMRTWDGLQGYDVMQYGRSRAGKVQSRAAVWLICRINHALRLCIELFEVTLLVYDRLWHVCYCCTCQSLTQERALYNHVSTIHAYNRTVSAYVSLYYSR